MSILEHFSWKQQAAIVIIPKITSLCSIGGSLRLLFTILKKRQRNGDENSGAAQGHSHKNSSKSLNKSYGVSIKERLLIGISIVDILSGLCYFMGTWAFPADTNVWGAIGNAPTCNMSGVLRGVGFLIYPYTMAMGLYYYVAIKGGVQGIQKLQRYEKYIHGSIIFFGVAMTVVCLLGDVYAPRTYVCFTRYDPNKCDPDDKNCIREQNGNLFWLFMLFAFPLLVSFLGSLCFMPMIYYHVRKRERAMYRYSASTPTNHALRAVAIQGFLYMGALLMCTIPGFLTHIVIWLSNSARPNFSLTLFTSFVEPFQGFFNMIVYHRTIKKDARRIEPDHFGSEEMEKMEAMEHEFKEAMDLAFNVPESTCSNHPNEDSAITRHLSLEAINIKKKNTLRLHSNMFLTHPAFGTNVVVASGEQCDTFDHLEYSGTPTAVDAPGEQGSTNAISVALRNENSTTASALSQLDVEDLNMHPRAAINASIIDESNPDECPGTTEGQNHNIDPSTRSEANTRRAAASPESTPLYAALNEFGVSDFVRYSMSTDTSVTTTNTDENDDLDSSPDLDVPGSMPV